jgi:hypothetical protein
MQICTFCPPFSTPTRPPPIQRAAGVYCSFLLTRHSR